jgi:hypothetical protein
MWEVFRLTRAAERVDSRLALSQTDSCLGALYKLAIAREELALDHRIA